MKIFILITVFIINLYGNIEVHQNIKALYKNVKINNVEKDYILNNKDENIEILQKKIYQNKRKIKITNETIVIEFILTPKQEIINYRYIVKSEHSKNNKIIKQIIKNLKRKFIKPKQKTKIRYIIKISKNYNYKDNYNNTQKDDKVYYQNIPRGTTRFEYSSKEYVRIFETNEDGFINTNFTPGMCGTIELLTIKNQKINNNFNPWKINREIPKGKYKILIKTKKTCDLNIQYP